MPETPPEKPAAKPRAPRRKPAAMEPLAAAPPAISQAAATSASPPPRPVAQGALERAWKAFRTRFAGTNIATLLGERVQGVWLVTAVLIAGAGGAVLAQSATSDAGPGGDRAAIEAVVRDYILAHPEIIPEAMNRLQSREASRLLAANRSEIETPFAGAVVGNPRGDTSLVVFFDYACPYCRQGSIDVERLAAEDKQLRIVFRDFPVLSPLSEEAAMSSLSAAQQNRYVAFHDAMFKGQGRVSRERTVATVRSAGLNEARTARDMQSAALKAEIRKNLELGRALGLTGTPSYIVGDRVLSGAVGYEALKAAVAETRAARSSAASATGG